jgi:large subunit ribosomal protein L9
LDNSPVLVYDSSVAGRTAIRQTLDSGTESEVYVQVILIQDVEGMGKAGDLKTVADGYGRNYLIRRGLAKPVTAGELKQVEQHRRAASKRAMRELTDAQAMAERLSQMTLVFKARAGEGTKLYGSITSGDIADRISRELGREFDRRKVHLDESLRQLGSHRVPVRLMADITPEVTVVIERDEEAEAE